MKILINTLLIKITVFLIFGECIALENASPHHREVEYKFKTIKLWLDDSGTRVTNATYPGSFIPTTDDYYRNNNVLIRMVREEGFRFVAYITENKQLLGVRAPIDRDPFVNPEPTDVLWHIFCRGKHLRLTVDPLTELELGITLLPRNSHRRRNRPLLAIVAGIEFYVFKNRDGEIVAASLPSR